LTIIFDQPTAFDLQAATRSPPKMRRQKLKKFFG